MDRTEAQRRKDNEMARKWLIGALSSLFLFSVSATAHAGPKFSALGATINSGGPGFGSINDTFNQNGLLTGYPRDIAVRLLYT